MKKFFITLLVVFLVLTCAIAVLHITPIDNYLTQLIYGAEEPQKHYIIHSDITDEKYSIDDPSLPYIYVENRMLYMSYKGKAINITPKDINVSYYNNKEGIDQSIFNKNNCKVSDDGRYVVYVLSFNDMSYLYYCDLHNMSYEYISDKVNSFEFVSIPDAQGL